MREQLGMTPYMMQIALNQTLKQYFKGKKYAGPGGTKELNFYEQDLPISEDTDDDVDFPAACSPYIITELGDIKSPVGNEPMTVNVTLYIGAYDKGHQRQGYRDVLNIEYAIMRRFRVCPRFGRACTVEGEIKGKMSKDDYHPYYFGAVEMIVTVANPTPEGDPETEAMI